MSGKAQPQKDHVKVVAQHRRAKFDYTVEDKVEAGLQLMGSEVKSLREGTANLNDAYAMPKGTDLYLHNAHIGPYKPSTAFGHEPLRARKLLMHREQIDKWAAKVKERGYSIIPLMLYFKNGRAKVELGLCRGKTHEDRRQDIKERETKRELDRAVRRK
ncbi:MAG: SsrA-binding protein SmpB [Myxococcaceae bacterium]